MVSLCNILSQNVGTDALINKVDVYTALQYIYYKYSETEEVQ